MAKEEKGFQVVRGMAVIAILAIFGVSWYLISQRLDEVGWIKSKHRFDFPNGGGFHVFELAVTDSIYLESSQAKKRFAKGDLRTAPYQDGGWMEFHVDQVEETYVGRRLELETEGLVLVAGVTDPSGKKVIPRFCRWAFSGEFAENHYQPSGAAWQPLRSSTIALDYGVEVEDGKGGWIPLYGPYTTEEGIWKTVLTAPVFPRNRSELRLRIERRGSPPLVVAVPNPAYGVPVKSWKAEAKPYRKSLKMGEVRLGGFEWRWPRSGGGPELKPKLSIHPVDGRQPEEFRARINWIADDVGNEAVTEDFVVVEGVEQVKLRGLVRPDYRRFRWKASELELLAVGTWSDGSENLPLELKSAAKESGLASICYQKDGPMPNKLNFRVDWNLDRYQGNTAPRESIARGMVLLLDEETVSHRASELGSGAVSFDNGNLIQAYRFLGMEGNPQEGQKLRLARIREDREESFEFTIPASEIPPPPVRKP